MQHHRMIRFVLTLAVLWSVLPPAFGQTSIQMIPKGSTWSFLDDGSDQGTAWSQPGFIDTSWLSGPAELGYNTDATEPNEATVLGFGGNDQNKYITYYFRRTFNVASPSAFTHLRASILRDDGAVAYLNGTEIFRDHIPAGPVTFSTLADVAVGGNEELAYIPHFVPASLLITGPNVLAVEVHQSGATSTDLSFDLNLIGNPTPEITITSPTNTALIAAVNINITTDPVPAGSAITKVEFFQGATKLGESAATPYNFVWTGVAPGNYSLTAVITDNLGLQATSPAVNITVVTPPPTLVPANSVWKYLDNGVDQGTAWRALDFNDASWSSGPGELGYGDGGEATVLGFGPDTANKFVTYYFRRKFEVIDPNAYGSIPMTLTYDDGAIIYLNGVEVYRINLPDGPLTFGTYASSAGEYSPITAVLPISALVPGMNIVAVELHQGNATSSDLSMDLQLLGDPSPSVVLTSPLNGATITGPTDITVTADATDTAPGAVNVVEFYSGENLIGFDATPPYSIVWSNVTENIYQLSAVATDNSGGQATSPPITITVVDPNPPAINQVFGVTNEVTVVFTKRVEAVTALNINNYTLDRGATVESVSYAGGNLSTVILKVSLLTVGVDYRLTVNNVKDLSGLTIAPNSQTIFSVSSFITLDIGNPAQGGVSTAAGGGFDLVGGGTNIVGTADQFFFSYQQVTGDFDQRVRVEAMSLSDAWAKAGLMARETLAPNSRHASAFATPNISGCFFQHRFTVGGNATNAGSFPVAYPNTWLRLKREGNTFTGYAGLDGQNWTQLGSITLNAANAVFFVGQALSSASATATASASFRDIGNVVGGTVGTVNLDVEPLGPSSRNTGLVISEFMYNPQYSNDLEFIEIFNSQPFSEDLTGFRIAGDVDYAFPSGTVLRGGGLLVVARDPALFNLAYPEASALGPFVETNALPNGTGRIRLRNELDAVLLEINYRDRTPWPVDGDGTGHSLVLARPSYGEDNPKAWAPSSFVGGSPGKFEPTFVEPVDAIVINEFLAHTDDPVQDFIELYNKSNFQVNISGCRLSDTRDTNRFRIPNGTILQPRSFISFNQTTLGFNLSAEGERIFLVNSNQNRVLDAVQFDGQANGVSTGRYPDGAPSFHELLTQTPGTANTGLRIRAIVINEIMYNPISDDENDEYVELHNSGNDPVNVGGWEFTDGVDFTIPENTVIPSHGFLVVAKNQTNLVAKYSQLTSLNTVGNYGGSLSDGGEHVALSMPDEVITFITNEVTHVVTMETNIIFIVMDEVTYGEGGRWGDWSDRGGSSLELIDARSDNRLAPNWGDSDETSKAPWTTIETTGNFDNGQGANNELQIMILGKGECLVDDLFAGIASGPNTVLNPQFDNALASWLLQGNHIQSSIDANEGFPSAPSLHIRATSGGDNGANRVEVDLNTTLPTTGAGTLRGRFRWLRGFPIVLLKTHGNWLEAAGTLTLPSNLGSPGLPNSIAASNRGPAITDVAHRPIVPAGGEPVVVSARVHDPDGVASVILRYRQDPSASLNPVVMRDDGTGGDALANDGIYSARIEGAATAAGNLVAFRVEATDAAAAPSGSLFPNDAPKRECHVRFGDDLIPGNMGVYRMWMTAASMTDWAARAKMSNEGLDGTFVYNQSRVIYNANARYRGSPFIRPGYNTPTGAANAFVWGVPEDDLFLGNDEMNMDSLEPTGRDATTLREIIAFWIGRKLGLTFSYQRSIHVVINGASNGDRNIPCYSDSQQPDSAYLSSWFPDEDGQIFKIDDWFEFNDSSVPDREFNVDGDLRPHPTTDLTTGLDKLKKSRYRWSWEKKFIRGRLNDDYSAIFDHVNVFNANPLNVAQIESVIDSEIWMTGFAHRRLISDWDGYGYDRGKNSFLYIHESGKSQILPWDLDFALGCNGGHGPAQNVLNGSNDSTMTNLRNHPHFLRIFHRALQRAVNGPLVASTVVPMIDERYRALQQNGVANVSTFRSPFDPSGAQNISIPAWIQQRRDNLLTVIPTAAFAVLTPDNMTIANNLLSLSGTAPVLIKDIFVNGIRIPLTWNTVTGWTAPFVVQPGLNHLVIEGRDLDGNRVGNVLNLNVTSTVAPATPQDSIVINEIMYKPTIPGAAYLEIFNRSATTSFDMSGWQLNGLGFTFPEGSIITNNQHLVVVENAGVFSATYGGSATVSGEYDGVLDLDGETLSLIIPSADASPDVVVDKVRYEPGLPWATTPNGTGPSLMLIDPSKDNSRPSNWSDGVGWRQFVRTGVVGTGGSSMLFALSQAGNIYIDDVEIVLGSTPGAGPNLIVNPGFETGVLTPWTATRNHINSVVTTEAAYSGTHSLKIIAEGAGSTADFVRQTFATLNSTATYTVSFRYLPVAANNLKWRVSGSFNDFNTGLNVTPIKSTPGFLNTSTDVLPAYDPVWLNELQAQNTTGPVDGAGQRDPWIELYNSGTSTVNLSGYYLANTYNGNLLQWQFPATASIGPGQYKIVWVDGQPGQTVGNEWHTSFALTSLDGTIALVRIVNALPQITDYLTYTQLPANLTYGDFPDGQPFTREILGTPTPGALNIGKTAEIFINEWMASNTQTLEDPAEPEAFEDWFELYNPGDEDVDLSGYFLTDNLNVKNRYPIPAGTIIPAGGYLLVWADDDIEQNTPGVGDLHANFALGAGGEEIGLFTPTGIEVDSVVFGAQSLDVSQGRFPDASSTLSFMNTPTPRGPNTLSAGNATPVLGFIPNASVLTSQNLNFQATATDADLPPQTLTFTLGPGAPFGAAISTAGLFTWIPSGDQADTVHNITVRVTDNGVPPKTDQRTFTVTVQPRQVDIVRSGPNVVITFATVPNKHYKISRTIDLNPPANWIPFIESILATGSSLTINDLIDTDGQSFYKIEQID